MIPFITYVWTNHREKRTRGKKKKTSPHDAKKIDSGKMLQEDAYYGYLDALMPCMRNSIFWVSGFFISSHQA